MTINIILVDLTTSVTPDNMKPAPLFDEFIVAWLEQIEGPLATTTDTEFVTFRKADSVNDRQSGEIAINFRDTIPEAPGALAYHQVVNGIPDIEIGADLFLDLASSDESVSKGCSHEILEMLKDAGANGWKDKQDSSGMMCAEELCDVVQNTSYQACNGLPVSNFLLPSYFIPGSVGPWDYLELMTSQTDISHGYEIQTPSPTQIVQVGGMRIEKAHIHGIENLTELSKKRKSHPYSRTHRRGGRLIEVVSKQTVMKEVVQTPVIQHLTGDFKR
jgi:hypothetical protein